MKTRITAIVILTCLSLYMNSQNPFFQWAKNMGGAAYDEGNSIVTDAAGNVYTTGLFNGIADFDPGTGTYTLASSGAADVFVSKLDAQGNIVWAKSIGGPNAEYGASIALDTIGNIVLTGYFYGGSTDFNPGVNNYTLASNGSSDVYVCKLDSSGNFLWAHSFGAASSDMATEVKTSLNGDVFVTGTFQGTVDFDHSPSTFALTSAGYDDMFLLKLDASGNFISAFNIGDVAYDTGNDLHIDQNDNIYVTGGFKGAADFDPGASVFSLTTTSNGGTYILKLTQNLGFVMACCITSTATSTSYAITTDSNGNIIITGAFNGTFDFDPGTSISNLTAAGQSDIFVVKLDGNGNFLFARKFGGSSNDTGIDIAIDNLDCLYITGFFSGTVDFDPSAAIYTLNTSGQSGFISKLSSAGTFMWALKIGSTNTLGKGITVGAGGIVSTTGIFHGTGEFDPAGGSFLITSAGMGDIFVHSIMSSLTTNISSSEIKSSKIFPNPTKGILYIDYENAKSIIYIYNILGKAEFQKTVEQGRNELNLSFLSPGIYFLISEKMNKKIILE